MWLQPPHPFRTSSRAAPQNCHGVTTTNRPCQIVPNGFFIKGYSLKSNSNTFFQLDQHLGSDIHKNPNGMTLRFSGSGAAIRMNRSVTNGDTAAGSNPNSNLAKTIRTLDRCSLCLSSPNATNKHQRRRAVDLINSGKSLAIPTNRLASRNSLSEAETWSTVVFGNLACFRFTN